MENMSQILKLYYLNIRGIKSKFKPLFTVTKECKPMIIQLLKHIIIKRRIRDQAYNIKSDI